MNYFSKNTLKHAQTLFRIKDELKVTLDQNDFDEVDLYKFADELIKSLQPEKQKIISKTQVLNVITEIMLWIKRLKSIKMKFFFVKNLFMTLRMIMKHKT